MIDSIQSVLYSFATLNIAICQILKGKINRCLIVKENQLTDPLVPGQPGGGPRTVLNVLGYIGIDHEICQPSVGLVMARLAWWGDGGRITGRRGTPLAIQKRADRVPAPVSLLLGNRHLLLLRLVELTPSAHAWVHRASLFSWKGWYGFFFKGSQSSLCS